MDALVFLENLLSLIHCSTDFSFSTASYLWVCMCIILYTDTHICTYLRSLNVEVKMFTLSDIQTHLTNAFYKFVLNSF